MDKTSEMTTSAGTKVVPREPTIEMIAAGANAVLAPASADDIALARKAAILIDHETNMSIDMMAATIATMIPFYRAMLAAAPSAPVQAGELVHNLKFAHGVLVELTKQAIDAQAPTVLIGTGIANRAIVLIEQAAAEIERLSAVKPAAVVRRDLQTGINHRRDPHCIGCWHIQAADKTINANINALCNECGEVRDITAFLDEIDVPTDEKGRPLTHWGGMAEKVDAGSAGPAAVIIDSQFADFGDNRIRAIKLSLGVNLYDDDELYTRPPAPKVSTYPAIRLASAGHVLPNRTTVDIEVNGNFVTVIQEAGDIFCHIVEPSGIESKIREALELAGRK